MVNCEHPTYRADIVRLICADNSPAGPGYKETPVRTPVGKRHEGRRQAIHAGSYALVESRPLLEALDSFTVQAMIWPTTPGKGRQGIVTKWDGRAGRGFALVIDEAGAVALTVATEGGAAETVLRRQAAAGAPLVSSPPPATMRTREPSPSTRSRFTATSGWRTRAPPGARWRAPPPPAAPRRSSWPASSRGGRRAGFWSTGSTTGRSIRPASPPAPWTGWRSSACGTRPCPRRSHRASSAPGISPGTSRRSGSRTARRTVSTARSSTCRRAA